jgi:hypothetical protein
VTDASFVQGTKELLPIFPTRAGVAVVPDKVAVVLAGSDVTLATFGATPSLNAAPAVWVQALTPGTYKVLCQMNPQGDTQAPVWELDGQIIVHGRA